MSRTADPSRERIEQRAPWYGRPELLARVLQDFLADGLARLRPGAGGLPPRPWPDDLSIADDLGCDSIERLALAAGVAGLFGLVADGGGGLLQAPRLRDWVDRVAAGFSTPPGTLTFRTSGSTGEPRLCPHAVAALDQEVTELGRLLPGRSRILAAVPAHHIYGFLFTVLLPARMDCPVLDIRDCSPEDLGKLLRPGDLVVGHPLFWGAVRDARLLLPGDLVGVTSTAPCPDALAEALAHAGIGRLLQVYGSSETAGIGWREQAGEPFSLFSFWMRGDVPDDLIRQAPDGGTAVLEAPDRLAWQDNRRFDVAGRRDGAVQVAGHNVYPSLVRQRLLSHPGVEDAAVRLMRPDQGARLKAFVVPKNPAIDVETLRKSLTGWCRTNLEPAERPVTFRFGRKLPTGAQGKSADWHV